MKKRKIANEMEILSENLEHYNQIGDHFAIKISLIGQNFGNIAIGFRNEL